MKHDEEQQNTTEQEITIARREIAKGVNSALDHGVGEQRLAQLVLLATVIEKVR